MIARMGVVCAGICTLVLAGAGTSSALDSDGWDPLWGLNSGDARSENDIRIGSGHHCRSASVCINGPVNSGKLKDSQNVLLSGNNDDSGSPTIENGTIN